MKLFNILTFLLIINLIFLSAFVTQSNALSKRKMMMKMKKLGALAMLMKLQGKKKMLAIPIPIPIPIGLLKQLKKSKDKDFFCKSHHQAEHMMAKGHQFSSWSTPAELIQPTILHEPLHHQSIQHHQIQTLQPIQQLALKSEPIIALPISESVNSLINTETVRPIAIPIHTIHQQSNNHLVLSPETETVEFESQPFLEVEQSTEPINEQVFVRNNHVKRARLQNHK